MHHIANAGSVALANNQDALSRTQVQVKVWLSRRVWVPLAKAAAETTAKEAPPAERRPKRFPMPVVLSSARDCKLFLLYVCYLLLQGAVHKPCHFIAYGREHQMWLSMVKVQSCQFITLWFNLNFSFQFPASKLESSLLHIWSRKEFYTSKCSRKKRFFRNFDQISNPINHLLVIDH